MRVFNLYMEKWNVRLFWSYDLFDILFFLEIVEQNTIRTEHALKKNQRKIRI